MSISRVLGEVKATHNSYQSNENFCTVNWKLFNFGKGSRNKIKMESDVNVNTRKERWYKRFIVLVKNSSLITI